jgi:riboflavin biosynthesis pyrimidine reductase
MRLLERLFEATDLPAHALSPALERLHDGPLGFETPRVFANFVSTIDGVVAIPSVAASPSVISGKSEADRFMMGLLRAFASAVVVGARTVRAEPQHRWTPEHIYPQAADDFARLRRDLGLNARPELVILSASGELDDARPVLEDGALVISTSAGAERIAPGLPASSSLLEIGSGGSFDVVEAVAVLRSRGHDPILSEGGPSLMGQLVRHELLDELFLTFSPTLAGRITSEDRPGLVQGVDLLSLGSSAEVLSVRKHESHLFVRYQLSPSGREAALVKVETEES